MNLDILKRTAQAMVAPGKGILAIDESHSTCKKRFEAIGVTCNEETRRAYRGLLVTAPGIEEAISGYIMFDETLRQKTDDGTPFAEVLNKKGVMPGIKVDAGAKELALHPGEKVTEGLDGLRERLAEYRELGAKFAKWRAVITIGNPDATIGAGGLPSKACLMANAHGLARYAALCQEAGLVPMVEPEVLWDGDHTLERCYEVSAEIWTMLFAQLREQGVAPEGTILKTSMVLAGKAAAEKTPDQTVAEQTVRCLEENVPAKLAGVVFLSGGLSDRDSTAFLNLMNQLPDKKPWPLSFSYGRGIQRPALEAWGKDQSDIAGAQKLLVHRAKMNGLAARGKWSEKAEQQN
ncbi:MAG: class I fructose-bisphosphate aldolase [Candidatus Peregrinibacteria bacterium]